MNIACAVAAVLFGLFTFLQFNDGSQYKTTDGGVVGWVSLYSLTALISLLTIFRPLPRMVYLAAALLIGALGLLRVTAIQWIDTILYNESNPAGNESGGLFIVALWIGFLAWKNPVSRLSSLA